MGPKNYKICNRKRKKKNKKNWGHFLIFLGRNGGHKLIILSCKHIACVYDTLHQILSFLICDPAFLEVFDAAGGGPGTAGPSEEG